MYSQSMHTRLALRGLGAWTGAPPPRISSMEYAVPGWTYKWDVVTNTYYPHEYTEPSPRTVEQAAEIRRQILEYQISLGPYASIATLRNLGLSEQEIANILRGPATAAFITPAVQGTPDLTQVNWEAQREIREREAATGVAPTKPVTTVTTADRALMEQAGYQGGENGTGLDVTQVASGIVDTVTGAASTTVPIAGFNVPVWLLGAGALAIGFAFMQSRR